MSSIIEFFVAPDDTAAAGVVEIGPGGRFESAVHGNFDVWSTLVEWESILTGGRLEDFATGDGPQVVTGDGLPAVLAVAGELTRALAAADDHRLGTAAEQWAGLRADDGETIDGELARELVAEVAALAAGAVRTGSALYCRIC